MLPGSPTLSCLRRELPGNVFHTEGCPCVDWFWRSLFRHAGEIDVMVILHFSLNPADWWRGRLWRREY